MTIPQRDATGHPLHAWQEATWLLIALLTPLFVNLWVEQQFEASKIWLLRALVAVLVLFWLAGWISGLRPKPLPPQIRMSLIVLALVLILSTLFSPNRYIAIFGTLDRANGVLTQISYLLLFACVATQIDARQGQRLLHAIVLTAVPIVLLGLLQASGWQPLPLLTDARSPMTTTLGRANFTGAYLALLLPLTLTAAQMAKTKAQRYGYAALFVLSILVIGLSQARAAWIAAVVGICVLFWLRAAPRWSPRVRWISGLIGAAVVVGGLLLLLPQALDAGGSIAARLTIWRASLRLLWPRLWLGYGADTLELHFPSVYPPELVYYQGRGIVVDRAHNWLLDWSLNFGIVATGLFILLVALVVRAGWRQLTTTEVGGERPPIDQDPAHSWLTASIAALCAQLAGNLFLFDVAATAVVFWLLLAIVTATTTCRDAGGKELTSGQTLPAWGRTAVMVAGVFVFGWIVWQGSVRPLRADMHSWRGTQALSRGDTLAALTHYTASVQLQPQRAAYHVAGALTAAQLGHYDQAYRAMDAAIALRPTDPVLYTHLAAIYDRAAAGASERVAPAYRAYERAISLAPTIALTYQQYADLALRSGNGALALALAQQAVDLDATDAISFGIMGWSHLQAGNLSAALAAFEQATKWQPDSAEYHLGRATVYFEQGDLAAAHRAVQRSLTLDAAYAPALTLQVQLQQ